MDAKHEALEDYFDELKKIPQRTEGSCVAVAEQTSKILVALKNLYDKAYHNGFTDAANMNVNEA